ncbi:MAG: glycosyltransferase family 9 protein [Dysgonomonas sp.]
MANTLIIRYHRIGDALITLPLIYSLAKKYENDTFTVISNGRFDVFFDQMPKNVHFVPMIVKSQRGIFRGLEYGWHKTLLKHKINRLLKSIDKIAFFQLDSFERMILDKAKKNGILAPRPDYSLIVSEERLKNKCTDGLTILDLHKKVLENIGYVNLKPQFDASKIRQRDISQIAEMLNIDLSEKILAIAPFSKEEPKIYPLDKMEEVIRYLYMEKPEMQIIILGAGPREETVVNNWLSKYPRVVSLVDKIPFADEISLISRCTCVLTMDSANLHIARILSVPTVSLWGATIPENGYVPLIDTDDTRIVKRIDCQPCSLFGSKDCSETLKCFDIDPLDIAKVVCLKMQ